MWLRTRIFIHKNIKHYPDGRWHHVWASAKSLQCCPTLWDPMDCNPPGSSVHGISQAKYWNGLPFPSPEDLPDPGIESASLLSPALQAGSLPTKPPGKFSSCSYLPTFLHWYIYWFHLFINQTKHAFSKFFFCLFFLLLVMKSHRLSFSWAIFSQLGKAW